MKEGIPASSAMERSLPESKDVSSGTESLELMVDVFLFMFVRWFMVCGLLFVVCGLSFVLCSLWYGLWFMVYGLWFVVCGLMVDG